MDGPRAPIESEFPRVLDFLNCQLRPQTTWSIAKEYPTALTPSNLHNIRIIADKTQILSHAVMKPLLVRTPHVVLKVAAIGSVVTEESHRGQGLSRQILNSCLEESLRQNCDIAVLWTELYDFYRKVGFELAGYEETFVIDRPLQVPPQQLQIRKGSQISPEALLRVYQKHTVSTHRTLEEIRHFLQIPQSQVYTAWSPAGLLEGFAVEGKGVDLIDYIHEWSGSIPAILSLLNFIRTEKQRNIVLIAPKHSIQLLKALQTQGLFHHEGYLGMIKILNRENLVSKVTRAFKAAGLDAPALENTPDDQLTRALFGPWTEADQKRFLNSQTSGAELSSANEILPLRFWLWGWDSI